MTLTRSLVSISLCMLCVGATTAAQTPAPNTQVARTPPTLRIHDVASLSWMPAAVPGLELAVVDGNPQGAGPYAVAMRYKAGTKTPPHSHPEDMNLIVIRGQFFVSVGDGSDGSSNKPLDPGSVVIIPKGAHHSEGAITDSIVLICGPGPMQIDLTASNP